MVKTIFLWGVPGCIIAYTLTWANRTRPWERSNREDRRAADATPRCEIRRVSIAFDWTARSTLQSALDAAASRFDTTTPHGRGEATIAIRTLLATHIASARYACFQTFPSDRDQADDRFAKTCADLNARYAQATIENARRAQLSGEIFASAEEGQGLVVVSMVVGTSVPLGPLLPWPTRDTVRHALATLVPGRTVDLVSLEVVWSPSVDADRLSSAELQVLYPELVPLDRNGGVGRVICSHCRCVYARELGTCPACGSDESVPAPMTHGAGADGRVTSGTTMKCNYCRRPMPVYEVQCRGCGGRAAS